MTETLGTSSGSATNGTQAGTTSKGRRPKTDGANGLRLERLYTTAGVHPYDEVTWERRDVVLTNWRDGTVNF